jgi:hypothetical protein
MNRFTRSFPALAIIAALTTSCSKQQAAPPVAPQPAIKTVEVTVKQRSTTAIPGTDEAIRVTIDDITANQVRASLSLKDGTAVLADRSLVPGDAAAFEFGGASYRLKLKQLNNALIGEDFATFLVQPAALAFKSEKEKIEHLIQEIAGLKDAKFIRNGKEHTAEEAATHLRQKLTAVEKEIKTADEFVEKVATKSSLTDEPYTIRMADGKLVNLAVYLRERLRDLN